MATYPETPLRILFLTESREDYLADSILQGLISLGHEVTDYPQKYILYRESYSIPTGSGSAVRGGGFTLYGNLNDRTVDRSFIIQRLERQSFDLVIVGQIWRQWGQLLDLAPLLQTVPVVLLDGDDDTRLFHRSGTRLRRFGWQPFPIRSGRCFYFKRELQGAANQGRWCRVFPTSFSIPADKIRPLDFAIKKQRIASHCVDPEVAKACGLHTSYAFDSENAYYDDLALSRFAVTTKRGGWDCLRHYEIAAAGALPCVRQLETKPVTCAPHGLQAGLNCLSYQHWPDLQEQMSALEAHPEVFHRLLHASQRWVRHHTTRNSALRLLDAVLKL
ncbi:glycosyltransferase family 1 protein [Synechococcus sp. LTW-R]|uniref:glycosyltransferase family 1 protein n=1 Tax=Synechococcus sp. LTW-R TaxID=2751170 RepID=UPI001627EFAD|nr:glycosyltransferase family 1 protein [Synechococcus sp. LTW-R]QNG28973.1 glycosyltransferase family 1 protein [Synechococcus sp. LTW-R]